MKFQLGLALAGALLLAAPAASAATATKPLTSMEKNIETMGTGVAIALPLTALAITIRKRDRVGLEEFAVQTALTVGTAYALKYLVREQRPDGSDFHSFPSDTTALAASGSSFLWRRYGWQYGLPAYAVMQFVSYSRIQANKHHWYDTMASSAIAFGYSLAVTDRFSQRYHLRTSLEATPDSAYFQLAYNF